MREATEAEAKGLRDAEAMVAHFSRKPLQAISGFLRGDGPRFFSLFSPVYVRFLWVSLSLFVHCVSANVSLSLFSFFTIVVRKRATAS